MKYCLTSGTSAELPVVDVCAHEDSVDTLLVLPGGGGGGGEGKEGRGRRGGKGGEGEKGKEERERRGGGRTPTS